MQAAGWLYCILPGLEKIHSDNKEDLKLSMEHNLEFFNTHPFLVTFVMGIILSLEQQKADIETIRAVRVAAMRAEGVFFYTPEGKHYYDLVAGVSVSNVGHANPRVVEAVQRQAADYIITSKSLNSPLSIQKRTNVLTL